MSAKSSWTIALLVLFLFIGCKQNTDHNKSETITTTTMVGQDPPTTDAVQQAVSIFNEAMVSPTVELMDDLCADELTYGHSSGLIQNKAEFIDDIVNGPFDFLSVEAADQSIHISGNTAIVRHIFLAKGTNAGEDADVRIGNVQVYQKDRQGKLKLLARQAYKLPN
ncbi:nuclear transport factor 2 family protein [Arenibacter sp. F26102]|uniref:nuclear transport factor 2 family protein n=1 Tax=Arenibacter sp. F26102 TaxID=2926416 RepID=UPI001FF2E168|nr:nuclear transport factor 2 family protein [Arenibacter sp. F26102]MCK0146735.1 nuclear transport factor 2 family protein [Arenibacter sp. F26102]